MLRCKIKKNRNQIESRRSLFSDIELKIDNVDIQQVEHKNYHRPGAVQPLHF